ncbi:hypothetical protein CP061683_1444A, partial [Chlamydia psittaci 06-1683]
MPTLCL